MDAQQIKDAVKRYRKIFEKQGIGKSPHPMDIPMISKKANLENSHWMLDEIEKGLKEDDSQETREKYRGWLCWIQNDLFHNGLGTINDFRNDNRPKEKTTP